MPVCKAVNSRPNVQSEATFHNGIDPNPGAVTDSAVRAGPILFLAGLATGFISGQGLTIDGGCGCAGFASFRH